MAAERTSAAHLNFRAGEGEKRGDSFCLRCCTRVKGNKTFNLNRHRQSALCLSHRRESQPQQRGLAESEAAAAAGLSVIGHAAATAATSEREAQATAALAKLPAASSSRSSSSWSFSSSLSSSAPQGQQPEPAAGPQRDISLLHRIAERYLAEQYGIANARLSAAAAASASASVPAAAAAAAAAAAVAAALPTSGLQPRRSERAVKRTVKGVAKASTVIGTVTAAAAAAVHGDPAHVPFIYLAEVFNSLYGPQSGSGALPIQLWIIRSQDSPMVIDQPGGPHKVTTLQQLLKQPAQVYQMARQAVNEPVNDKNRRWRMSYLQLFRAQAEPNRVPMGELAFLDSMRDTLTWTAAQAASRRVVLEDYLKDIEDCCHLLWPTDEASSRQHFLNANLFNTSDRRSLLRLLRPEQRCSGFDTPSYYLKLPESFFRMHCEQLFAPFYNYCWQGCTIWYAVMEEDRVALEKYLAAMVARKFDIDLHQLWKENDTGLLWALVYSRQLFLDPFDLQASGVPVHRVEQAAGQAVVGKGTVLHWGLCGSVDSINEAVNWLPVLWLDDGLPQLVKHVDWLAHYVALAEAHVAVREADHSPGRTARAHLFDLSVQGLVAHHTPRVYTKGLCEEIIKDLKASKQECDYSALARPEEGFAVYIDRLEHVINVLSQPQVEQWCDRVGPNYS